MKELSIEEKAKRYDGAIERAKDFMNGEVHYELKTGENIMCWIFPELRESEDERMRKALIDYFRWNPHGQLLNEFSNKEVFSWLEKQGEHAKFRDSIQVGDKVTRNQDGVLVNLSQLNRVAKKDENQDEQKPAEWSEENKRNINELLYLVEANYLSSEEPHDRLINFLESLKDRCSWKPSEEQIKGIDCAIKTLRHQLNVGDKRLNSLYDDLKKLGEE